METSNLKLLATKYYFDNKSKILLVVACVLCLYIFTGIGISLIWGDMPSTTMTLSVLSYIIGGGVLCIISSLIFSDFKTKEGRISSLMLPGSMTEKFLLRMVVAMPASLILVGAGTILALASAQLTNLVYWHMNGNLFAYVFQQLTGSESAFLTVNFILSALVMQSVYFFGGILWPKLSFIKTFVAVQTVQIILSISIGLFATHLSSPLWLMNLDIDLKAVYFLEIGSGIAIMALFYWLAWKRFRNSQVIYKLF